DSGVAQVISCRQQHTDSIGATMRPRAKGDCRSRADSNNCTGERNTSITAEICEGQRIGEHTGTCATKRKDPAASEPGNRQCVSPGARVSNNNAVHAEI